jgi:hypothetical protein
MVLLFPLPTMEVLNPLLQLERTFSTHLTDNHHPQPLKSHTQRFGTIGTFENPHFVRPNEVHSVQGEVGSLNYFILQNLNIF